MCIYIYVCIILNYVYDIAHEHRNISVYLARLRGPKIYIFKYIYYRHEYEVSECWCHAVGPFYWTSN